jgi:hypothetical protein
VAQLLGWGTAAAGAGHYRQLHRHRFLHLHLLLPSLQLLAEGQSGLQQQFIQDLREPQLLESRLLQLLMLGLVQLMMVMTTTPLKLHLGGAGSGSSKPRGLLGAASRESSRSSTPSRISRPGHVQPQELQARHRRVRHQPKRLAGRQEVDLADASLNQRSNWSIIKRWQLAWRDIQRLAQLLLLPGQGGLSLQRRNSSSISNNSMSSSRCQC